MHGAAGEDLSRGSRAAAIFWYLSRPPRGKYLKCYQCLKARYFLFCYLESVGASVAQYVIRINTYYVLSIRIIHNTRDGQIWNTQ